MAIVTINFVRGAGDRADDPVIAPMLGDSVPAIIARGKSELNTRSSQLASQSVSGPYDPALVVQPCTMVTMVGVDGSQVSGRVQRVDLSVDFRNGAPSAHISHRIEVCA